MTRSTALLIESEQGTAIRHQRLIFENSLYRHDGEFLPLFLHGGNIVKTMAYGWSCGQLIGIGIVNHADRWIGCYVHPDFRRRGFSRRLVQRLDTEMRRRMEVEADETLYAIVRKMFFVNLHIVPRSE